MSKQYNVLPKLLSGQIPYTFNIDKGLKRQKQYSYTIHERCAKITPSSPVKPPNTIF